MVEGGLVDPTAERSSSDAAAEAGEQLATVTADAGTTEYAPQESSSDVSHLDSFIENSGWTREDLMTVATMLNTVLLLAWLYLEVKK